MKKERIFTTDDVTEVSVAIAACKLAGIEYRVSKGKTKWTIRYICGDMIQKTVEEFIEVYRAVRAQL